jgi:hypothetical protein
MRTALIAISILLATQVPAQETYQSGDMVHVKSASLWRVVAVPGDTVDLDRTGVYINRVRLPEFPRNLLSETVDMIRSMRVPDKHFLVIDEQQTRRTLKLSWSLTPADNLERPRDIPSQ